MFERGGLFRITEILVLFFNGSTAILPSSESTLIKSSKRYLQKPPTTGSPC
jgi:hypothetical protein